MKNHSNGIATAKIIRVINPNYSNSKDATVHQAMHNEQDNHQSTSYVNSSLILPEKNSQLPQQYYHEEDQNYSKSEIKYPEIPATCGTILSIT